MMKKASIKRYLGFLCICVLHPAWGLGTQLSLEVSNNKHQKGQLWVAIYQPLELPHHEMEWDFLGEYQSYYYDLSENEALLHLTIHELKSGITCIRLFVDLNNNKALDLSSIGLPLEPVGFANNPSIFMGKPQPKDACFILDQQTKVQKIKLKQKKKRAKKARR